MKLARKCLALVISSVIGTVGLLPALIICPLQLSSAQTQQNNPGIQPPADIPQATFADLWRVDHTFQSTIHMKNLLTYRSVQVTPALYMSDGTEYDLSPVTLGPSAMANVDLNLALTNAPMAIASHLSHFGNAALKYMHFAPGVIAGELTMVDAPRSLVFSSPFQMMMGPPNAANMMQTLEGMWWKHDENVGGFVNVTNTTDRSTNVSVQVIDQHGMALPPEAVSLNPHAEEMLDLNSLASGLPSSATHAGGVRVQYQGQMGDVEVSGGLENAGEGYSANMPFWQHDSVHVTKSDRSAANPLTLAAVGVMAGQPDPTQSFPAATRFTPYLALRNTTGEPLKLSPIIYLTNGAKTSSFSLPPEVLSPYASRQVDLADRLKSLRLQDFNGTVNITVSYSGAIADLLMAAGAVDQTGSFVFAVIPQVIEDGMAKDSSWMVGDGYDSMLSLWNPSNQPEDLVATFSYPDGSGGYKLPVHLDPYASMNIDVESLIAQQKPDADGNVIPIGTMQGRVIVSSPKGLSAKIKLALSSAAFNVTTATCCPNCVCCFGTFSVSISPSTATITGVGGTTQLHFYNDQWGGRSDDTIGANWTSDETASATVSSGLVTAVAGGGANIRASENLGPNGMICNCSPSCAPFQWADVAQVTTKANVTISQVAVNPGTIHTTAGGGTTSATVTITVFHEPIDSNRPQSVDVNVGTFSTTPAQGVSVAYSPQWTNPVTLSGPQGSHNYDAQVNNANIGQNTTATVTIAGSLTAPSSGLNVQAPNPAGNGTVKLTVHNP